MNATCLCIIELLHTPVYISCPVVYRYIMDGTNASQVNPPGGGLSVIFGNNALSSQKI